MKFFCEQCKAKYQIADDKVAGKTVRMKCRKCGHLIEVEASVTETSVAGKAPVDHAARLLRRRAVLDTIQPISAIAYASGFGDYANFARQFQRRFGHSPGAHAKRRD